MTVKEIAELCGVEPRTVRYWINAEDFLRENFSLRNRIEEKSDRGSPEIPSDYDLEETLAIIGEGGGNKTLAALLEENTRNKGALAVRQETAFPQFNLEKALENALSKTGIMERLERMEITQQRIEVEVLTSQTIQMRQLKSYLFDKIVITENRKDYVEFQQLYYDHGRYVSEPIPHDAFAHLVTYLYPGIKTRRYKGGMDFTGCRLKTPHDREIQ